MAESHIVSTATDRLEMALKTGDMNEVLLALHGNIHFVIKKLGKSQVPASITSKACRLKLPLWFVLQHGDKFQESVLLRCRSSTVPCKVQLSIFTKNSEAPEIRLGKGWRDFATFNRLVVGDSLIFELKGMSEFEVYVFRGTGNPTSSTENTEAPKTCSSDSEISRKNANGDAHAGCSRPQQMSAERRELSRKNGNDDASAGCSRPQQLPVERREGSRNDLCGWTVKKRKIKEEGAVTAPECAALQNSSSTNLHLLELGNVQVSPPEKHPDLQKNSQEPTADHQKLRASFTGIDIAQNRGAGKALNAKKDVQPSLPSFIKRLAEYNVQDSAGNTSGARFEIPLSFVMAHGIQLQAHVKIQGIHDKSPFRVVTCSPEGGGHSAAQLRPPLSLGWGDFVRDNALRTGQELVFTLAAESFFVVREVYEIVVYTK